MAFDPLLTIVQSVCGRIGLQKPNSVAGATDIQTIQLLELLNLGGQELAARYAWTALVDEASFLTLNQDSQGVLDGGILPVNAGFNYIINDTIFNRTTQFQVTGPLSPRGWQGLKAITTVAGFYAQFRIRDGQLLMFPDPPAGQSVFFEYFSENWVNVQALGANTSNAFANDTDIPLLDSRLLKLDLTWRWKAFKGLAYSEDMNSFENAVLDAMTRDGGKRATSLDNRNLDSVDPFILVSRGSWNITP